MQITIQKMWPLEAGRKSGGFKGTDGMSYYCEIPIYHMLSEGMTIDAPADKYVSKAGNTSYILAKTWTPEQPANGHIEPSPRYPQASPAPPRPAGNGYVPEMEKQGYIMCSVMMKLLADALLQAGKPIDTQDLPLLAQAAVATWRDHLKGKV